MSKAKIVWFSIVGFVVITALAVGSWGMATGFKYLTADPAGRAEAEVKIKSADFRIHYYEHFYELLKDINGAEAQWDTQWDLLQLQNPESETYQKTLRNLAVIKAQIYRLKVTYNADAAEVETKGQFRANELPERVDTSEHIYGNRTGGL